MEILDCDFECRNQIYELLQQDDYSAVVLKWLDFITKTNQLPKLVKADKCEITSTSYRHKGNVKYQSHNYTETLIWYNAAILFAPVNSTALKLGYGNRSALLYTIKAYKACLNDINTCFKLGCTDQRLADRLTQRKRECEKWIPIFDSWFIREMFTCGGTFFNFNVERNPQIPCASSDVAVNKEKDKLKVVAVKNIEVGTVVALEMAYVCELDRAYSKMACSYCHNFNLNLIPCDNCCQLMFCSEACMVLCNDEFHGIECQIIHVLRFLQHKPLNMMVKAAIKMRQMCSSWAEFIQASKNIGVERTKKSSINEIYDVKNKFSMLCFDNDLHFLHGQLYKESLVTARVIYYLREVPAFFPERQEERDEAIQALARVMVNLGLFYRNVEIFNTACDQAGIITRRKFPNYGWFSFAGKLKHSCDANLLVLGLNNKVALIAIKPIKKGDELTISYRHHYYDVVYDCRSVDLFLSNEILCSCRVCTEGWSPSQFRRQNLNNKQQRVMRVYFEIENALQMEIKWNAVMFRKTCNALTALQDAPATAEHHQLYKQFRNFIDMSQNLYTDNAIIA